MGNGNCFKAQNNDDISLLRGNDQLESSLDPAPFVEPPPPYRAEVSFNFPIDFLLRLKPVIII